MNSAVVKRPACIVLPLILLAAGCSPSGRWRVPGPNSRIVVPVFVLHRVMPGEKSEYIMTPEHLERLLGALRQGRFTGITPAQLEDALLRHGPLPPRPAMITFDDAYRDNYVYALPLLKRHGWKAVFFVPTGKMSDSPDTRVAWGDGPEAVGMTWDEVRALKEAGMDIGSHCIEHLNLRKVDEPTLRTELEQSRRTLEDKLGIRVTALAYPGGRQNEQVRAFAQKAGYTMAFLSSGGPIELPPEDLFRLPRVHVPGQVSPEDVVAEIPGCEWK